MTTAEIMNSVRAFVRNLNVVVKQVNLYGLAHKQVAPQLDSAWKELRTALDSGKLVITGAGDHLLVGGKPVSAGSADKALAQMMTTSGIAGICFFPELSFGQFEQFVRTLAVTKPPDLLAQFKKDFGAKAPVRLLEFRIGEEPTEHGMNLAGHIAAAMLGTVPASTEAKPATASDLLRTLLAPDANAKSTEIASAQEVQQNPAEDDITQTIRWLAKLGAIQNRGTAAAHVPTLEQLPMAAQQALKQALSAPGISDTEQPGLVALAEQLAVKIALDKYERGEIQLNAVQQMLQRLKLEISKLQGVVREQEDTMLRAGIHPNADAEALDRKFWAGVPAKNKLQVLLSPEAHCVPARNIESFAKELLEQQDRKSAEQVLRNYCAILRAPVSLDIKVKVAAGIGTLAATYARVSDRVTQWAMAVVASALSKTLEGELGDALSNTMSALGREAGSHAGYGVLSDYFDQLAGLGTLSEAVAEKIRAQCGIEQAVKRFVDDAVTALEPKPDLMDALRQVPEAVAAELKQRAARCGKREEYRRLTVLSQELGRPLLEQLKQSAKTDKPAEALLAAGLLAPYDSLYVQEILRKRMPGWAPSEQSAAIHQLASSGIAERGVVLTQLFDCFHELILPQAIDEIGISGSADVNKLVEISGRPKQVSPFIQLKIIEALGNLRARAALPLLRHFVLTRAVFKFEYAKETRIVAMQAMLKIDPLCARETMDRSGLTSDDLQLAPLRPGPGEWIRQRRYARISVDGLVSAAITSTEGSCHLALEAMSMGGGGGHTSARTQLSGDGMVEMQFGLRKVRARVLLHPIDTYKLGFEIASIPLDDRGRLRQFLTARQARPI
jgi:hypothetical protein